MKNIPFLPVKEPKVGELYHIVWASKKGMVWKCVSINEQDQTVILITPKTKRLLAQPVKINDLRHTRAQQIKILVSRDP